tara:strand:+ start:967 stop:1851 length:885 start_codon:yes stop_codon:yes gene_type:complete
MKRTRKPVTFRLSRAGKSATYSGQRNTVTYRIPSIDEIYDPKTNTNRLIRYVAGESSIYADEQTTKNPVLQDIVFQGGILSVRPESASLIKYLENCNYNKTNPNRREDKKNLFYKVDLEVNAEQRVADEETAVHATYAASTMDAQKLVGYARALGVNIDRSMYEIKWDMMNFAKSDPIAFLEGIDDPRTERIQVIMDAEQANILTFSGNRNEVCWLLGNTTATIVHVPVGADKRDYFVDWTFENEGEVVYQEILRKLGKLEALEQEEEEMLPVDEKVEGLAIKKPKAKKKAKKK